MSEPKPLVKYTVGFKNDAGVVITQEVEARSFYEALIKFMPVLAANEKFGVQAIAVQRL